MKKRTFKSVPQKPENILPVWRARSGAEIGRNGSGMIDKPAVSAFHISAKMSGGAR